MMPPSNNRTSSTSGNQKKGSRTGRTSLPKSERRRVYFKDMVARMVHSGIPEEKAKQTLETIIPFLQQEIKEGRTIDFGFMNLHLKSKAPRTIHFNLKPGQAIPVFMGQTYGWRVSVYESWRKRVRPAWCR